MAPKALVAAALYATAALSIQTHSKGGACQCLNWKETYAAGLAECGQGFELTRALGSNYGTAKEWLTKVKDEYYRKYMNVQYDLCDRFFKNLDDTKCPRTAMDRSSKEWYGKTWCYVSKECGSAMAVGHDVSVKFCEEGKDSLLSDMDPVALMKYGKRHELKQPNTLVKLAYPFDKSFAYLTEYSSFTGVHLKLTSETKVAAIRDSDKFVVLDSRSDRGDKAGQKILKGNMTWDVLADSSDWNTALTDDDESKDDGLV